MQLGIVLMDGTKIRNSEIPETDKLPIPVGLGLRDALMPDPFNEKLIRKKLPTVTSIVSFFRLCKLRVWFEYNIPIYKSVRSMIPLIHGTILHKALESSRGITLEREVHGELTDIYGVSMHIFGRIDAVNILKNEIYEFKTTAGIFNMPKESHMLQLAIYKHLLEQEAGNDFSGVIMTFAHDNFLFTYYSPETLSKLLIHEIKTLPIDFTEFQTTIKSTKYLHNIATLVTEYKETHSDEIFREIINKTVTYEPIYNIGLQTINREIMYWKCAKCIYRRYCPVGTRFTYEYVKLSAKRKGSRFLTKDKKLSRYWFSIFDSVIDSGVMEGDTFLPTWIELKDYFIDRLTEDLHESRSVIESAWEELERLMSKEEYLKMKINRYVEPKEVHLLGW